MAYWRKLDSRFDYEVAIGASEADRDRIVETVRGVDPDVMWIRVDGDYVICSSQSHSAISAMLMAADPEMRKAKK